MKDEDDIDMQIINAINESAMCQPYNGSEDIDTQIINFIDDLACESY